MAPTIREKVLHCSRLFNSVSAESEELQDVSQHFVNWYSNIAAHRAGPASLDERLRDAPDVRAAILRFLDILISMFEDCTLISILESSSKNYIGFKNPQLRFSLSPFMCCTNEDV
jgi:hypothetical protein